MKAKKIKRCGMVLGCLSAFLVYLLFIAICAGIVLGVMTLLSWWFRLTVGEVAIFVIGGTVVVLLVWKLLSAIFRILKKK